MTIQWEMGNSARSLKTMFITTLASVTVRHLYSYYIKKKNVIQYKLYKTHTSILPHNHSFFKLGQFHLIFIPTTFFLFNLQKSKKYQLSNSSKTEVPYVPHSSFPCKPYTNNVYIPNGTLFPM